MLHSRWKALARSARRLAGALLCVSTLAAAGPGRAAAAAPDAEAERFLREALERILAGETADALRLARAENARQPDEALPLVVLLFVYQMEMYERDDFRHEAQFERNADEALRRAQRAVRTRSLAWDHTMEAAIYGLQGLLEARREHWLAAARLGMRARTSLEQALKLDPGQADAYLGLGVYHYYGSVLTKKYWFLPGFGDQRERGLREVRRARQHGRYLAPLAEFALLYIHYEEKRFREALELARALADRYPGNALCLSWIGWMQLRLGRHGAAVESFRRVCEGGAGRYHCLYHLGTSRLLEGKDLHGALADLQAFLATEPPSWWRARAYYRIGVVHERLGDTAAARRALRAATYIDPRYRLPRERLARLEAGPQGQAGTTQGFPRPQAPLAHTEGQRP